VIDDIFGQLAPDSARSDRPTTPSGASGQTEATAQICYWKQRWKGLAKICVHLMHWWRVLGWSSCCEYKRA